ncbi:c-type cytochrome [Cloacibacterium sp.]|uniref:c-type cytochrome n=1 Tax=Cloacibacterium sp. TaxID=1913682 RepID=UPI0039E5DABA
MKNIRTVLSLSLFSILLASCNQNEAKYENTAETISSNPSSVNTIDSTPEPEGLRLIKGADCLSCHKEEGKLIGPSYKEIAAKNLNTPENIEKLSENIINGSMGKWGNVPMSAHPNLDKETAKKMIEYILTLK